MPTKPIALLTSRSIMTRILLGIVLLAVSLAQAQPQRLDLSNPRVAAVAAIQDRHTPALMRIPGVVGTATGIGTNDQVVVTVFTEIPGILNIPSRLDGVDVQVEVTGRFQARVDPAGYFRPAPIGVSIGHPDITAGTLGCLVRDGGGNTYILSNNHVLANVNQATPGDPILQPGPYDGGTVADPIGTLFDYVKLEFGSLNNQMDAAIASVIPSDVTVSTPGIIGTDSYGVPNAITLEPAAQLKVQKYGRTTGWTHGEISQIHATVDVCYESRGPFCTRLATFSGQIIITPGTFSAGGDSGSLIVTDDGNLNPVGLLFAGSDTHTIATPIQTILEKFNVGIDDGATAYGSLVGTVTDDATPLEPIPNATVFVSNGRHAATDDAGFYTFAAVPTGTYTITASAPGYLPAAGSIEVSEGANTLDFTLAPQPFVRLSGSVTDRDTGNSIPGASVSSDDGLYVVDASSGTWSLDLPGGTYTLTAAAPGYADASTTLTVSQDRSGIDFLLAPGLVIPTEFADQEAASWSSTLNKAIRLQEVYSASYFPGPVAITGLAFRTDNPSAPAVTSTDVQIRLSTTQAAPDNLSTRFSNNVGSDALTVYNGTLSVKTTEPNAFQIEVDFEDGQGKPIAFDYNPAEGNLLVDVTTASSNPLVPNVDASSSPADKASRVFALNPTASRGTADTGADVLQLTLAPSTPPPPANQPPTVSLTAPTLDVSFPAGSPITVSAEASDPDGSITRVDFYANESLIGTDSSYSYSILWTPTAGSYTLYALAVDNEGATSTSKPVTVTVTSVGPNPTITVSALSVSVSKAGKNWKATATAVVTSDGARIPGATVQARWFYNDSALTAASAVSDSNGIALLLSPTVKTSSGTFRIEIDRVELSGYDYAPDVTMAEQSFATTR